MSVLRNKSNLSKKHRAVVGGPAGQAMARPVLGLSKQYIGLEVVMNYIAAYDSNLLVHCLKFYFTLSYDKSLFFDCGIHL